MLAKTFLALGAGSGFFAVVLGAFGAHALKSRLGAEALASFNTAVHYQFFHSLALLAVGILLQRHPGVLLPASGAFFALGTVLFSGSIYLLTLGLGPAKVLGPVTPLGGLSLMLAWLLLFVAVLRH